MDNLATIQVPQRSSAENGIESVSKNASEDNFEMKKASDGREYFVLKATNGQVIGQSQMYESESGCTNGIDSCKENGVSENVKDLTEG